MIRTLDNVVNPVQIGQQALLPTSADTDDDDDDDEVHMHVDTLSDRICYYYFFQIIYVINCCGLSGSGNVSYIY
jgi:hypothetical protein